MIKRLLAMAALIGVTIASMVFAPDAAWAGKRVALIVGNSTYQTVPQLPNPSRDATSVAKMFRDAGFDSVDLVLNVGNLEFKRAIRKFEAAADQAEMAVVYYAGHGLEIAATNYLIPVDARLASDRDAEDEAIPLERLVSSADGASRLRLIILDACRDNPFVSTMRRERKVASRAVAAGLGKVEPTSTDTLIAYAAKAGSTADDGDGEHSPFTAAILKDLTVPGLDVRLAFGRVRDDVLKSTGNRQEPFVYGSLGGGNVSLVPAPEKPQEVPVNEVKADYELVQKIGTKRAWEVFLGTHPNGFYAELAKAQIERISIQPAGAVAAPPPPAAAPVPNITVAALPEQKSPNREASSREAAEWDKVKDATDPALLQKFISRFPDSPLALNAQQRIDVLKRAQADREQQARQAAEQARQAAEQKKREDDARRAAAAEAAEKAKAAAAALAAQKKREEDDRRAAAAEADRQAKAAEAARKAEAAQQKAEQAERDKAAAAAAVAAAAAEKQAREAEAARKKAELAAQKEATCKDEQGKLEAILTKGSDGTGVDDLKTFSRTVTCDRLGPVVVAAIDRFNAEAAKRAAVAPNSPQLVTSAQNELVRLGCMTGKADGTLNPVTTVALTKYLGIEGQPTDKPTVTQDLVTELSKHTTRVCPIECKTGETLKGETCVADKPDTAPATASRKNDDIDDSARRKQAKTQPDRDSPRKKPATATAPEAPRARAQALARPSIVSGGGGGGGGGGSHTMIGVGF
jgi:DNA segregation ATPase FtsK/SpoIIIE-like protein